jgi:hypothetical protein
MLTTVRPRYRDGPTVTSRWATSSRDRCSDYGCTVGQSSWFAERRDADLEATLSNPLARMEVSASTEFAIQPAST